MMEMTHRQVILDLLAKRFENVLGDDARDVLQILMELYCDAKALDQIAIENRPTVLAAPPAPPKPKKSKSGGSDTDKLADAILSAGKKPKQANAVAQEDKRRIYQLIRDGYAADREGFLDAVYAAGEGAVEREELRGMMNGLKYPIDCWRAAEEAIIAAGY